MTFHVDDIEGRAIEIRDNGLGMSRDDIIGSFMRLAT